MRRALVLTLIVIYIIVNISSMGFSLSDEILWTKEQKQFVIDHPVIRIGVDPKFVPFEFIDVDGIYKGITSDYLKIVSEKTGIQFQVVENLTWVEAYNLALKGEIDMLPAISKTKEREEDFLFSEPYYNFKRVIVTRDDETNIYGIEDLDNLTVAVQKSSSHHSYLLGFPRINLSLYDSVEEALTSVANGTERAFVGNLASTNYLIRSNALTNLRFTAFEADSKQSISFAFRKDWPELQGILNKVLGTITEEEKMEISERWINLETEFDYGPIIRLVSIIGMVLAIIIGVSLYWIIRLRKEIEKRKEIQKDLEIAKEIAEDANKFKSSFMARMSHEIRTPLNAITGMAYLLKKTNISLTQSMYIDRITQASNNVLSIVNDILDYSKIEAGKVELEITSFSLDQVIQSIVNIVSYKIESQRIGLKLSKDPRIPNWFYGDQKRIEQILLNLLNNAAKFTNEGEVSLDIRLLANQDDKYHITFTISDTGIGMNQEQIDKLFNPFVQGDITINRRFGGSGLGLSIVKNLVEMMNGKVQVFSTEGKGSTFIVHLTLEVDKNKEGSYSRDISTNLFKDLRTLVLEKTGSNMNLIESYLGSFGMHCELTTSENSALNMLEAADGKFSKTFDLFVMDFETPSEGGLIFIDRINKSDRIVKKPKIIVLLPMMREDLLDRLNDKGVELGIVKPVIPSVLLNGIIDIFNLKAVNSTTVSIENIPKGDKMEKNYCVLIVEDNKTNQMIARTLLQQAGIDSIVADNGKLGIEEYEKNKNLIDLILMDLHMPIMNGYDSAKGIRTISEDIPIIAMTADVILGVKEECEKSGIYHYISKPFNPEYFVKAVKDIIESSTHKNPMEVRALDIEAGLSNIGGDEKIYKLVLEEFVKENANTIYNLEDSLKDNNISDAIQIVHKVKGSSGSIGGKILYNLAVDFQSALKNEEKERIIVLKKSFINELSKLLSEINEL